MKIRNRKILNICDLSVTNIKITNNGYDKYYIHLRIEPTDAQSKWIPLSTSYFGYRFFGARETGEIMGFSSVKVAVNFIKSEYGNYGISLLCDEYLNPVDVSEYLI